jgi:hypothetical protein
VSKFTPKKFLEINSRLDKLTRDSNSLHRRISDEEKKFNNIDPRPDRKGNELLECTPIPSDPGLDSSSALPSFQSQNPELLTGASGENVLDRFIPAPASFVGPNNPFRFREDKIREARKMICTRKLELDDITKVGYFFYLNSAKL